MLALIKRKLEYYINFSQSKLQSKEIIKDKEKHYIMIKSKQVNVPRGQNNPQCVFC